MFDIIELVKAAGYFGVFAVIFAESGLLFGFFLPGDSLLFTAGFLASQGYLNIFILVPLLFFAAIAGDNLGYVIGKKIGPHVFSREESFFFHKKNIEIARAFFEKHGVKSIILARFLPVVRAIIPILAGVGKMDQKTFFMFDLLGGLIWGAGITLAGYFLGNLVPNVDKYLLPIIGTIILSSFLPTAIHIVKNRKHKS
ncbi:MAG: hypothetical protein A3J67_02145 [Parcubacteria group bacterium RIFCSPHIGHO2_02_FULL_48_10b]|nr:MAG: hypothetical protein A3J67_02145 [Parcubacteria group bacterium RIFCSPHIGHO2_02_FULL_48_10b]